MSTVNSRARALVLVAAAGLVWGTLSPAGHASAQVTAAPMTCTTPMLTALKVPALAFADAKMAVTVKLSCPPAAPVAVSLASDNPNLPVPGTVTVNGGHTSATIHVIPMGDTAGQYQATLTASLNGKSLSQTVTVDPGLSGFQLPACSDEPNCVDPTVEFTGPAPAGGLTVQFASSNPAVTVPSSVTFQQGAVGGGISATVNPVTVNTRVTISATLGGRTLRASKVLLPPFGPGDSIRMLPESGQGGHIYGQEFNLEYLAQLSNPAGDNGVTVTFSSPSPSIEFQNTSDFISPGFTDGFTDINTANVTQPVHTSITATADGVSRTLPVVIEPGLASFTGLPTAIEGGKSFTGTINLAGPVDTRTTVTLQSTDGVLSVPVLVHIPAGHSSATFKATTVPVTARTGVSIIAMLGSTTLQSNTITLTP